MQIVKYKWETGQALSSLNSEPFLFAREDGRMEKIKLFDKKLDIKIGEKYCVGYYKKGRHFDCPKKRVVDNERVCRECALNDDFFLCMKCTGEECINEPQRASCTENMYFIYLAAFNSMLKVGISYQFRIMERLIEQGADMGAKIGLVRDGKTARQIEQKIGRELNIIDRVSGIDKQKMLFGNINVAAMNIFNAYSRLKSNGFGSYLISPEIYNLQGIYRLSAVSRMPVPLELKDGTCISGDVLAAKGNIIVIKNETGLFSVNASKLLGCGVELLN